MKYILGVNVMKNQSGFTMMEILICIALLGMVVVGLLDGLALTAETVPVVEHKVTGLNLAESQMEFIRTQNYADGVPPDTYDLIDLTDFPNYGIDVDVVLLDPDPVSEPLEGDGDDDGLQQIVVTVVYSPGGGGTPAIIARLETRRVNPQI